MMENLVVPNDVINFIATKIETNIRELEGALIRIVAYSSLTDSPIELKLAEHVLKDILPDETAKCHTYTNCGRGRKLFLYHT